MAFPSYIPTRVVSVGGSSGLESGRLLRTVVDIKSSRSLIWDDTGARLESTGVAGVSSEGSEVTFELPRTDVQGWKDAKTGSIIDVSAPEAYSHRYVATVGMQDESGRKVGASYTLGPFVVTAGDGPIDLDKMVPASTVAGDAVSVPDRWAGLVGDALQAAVDSANAAEAAAAALVDSAAFVDATAAAKIADPTSATGAAFGATALTFSPALLDLRKFVPAGQAFPNNGTLDAAPIINAALTEARARAAADPSRVYQVFLPEGRYRLNAPLDLIGTSPFAERIGVVGEGRSQTILLPHGTVSAFTTAGAAVSTSTPLDFFWFRDIHFADFTVDCRNQAFPEPNGFQKAFEGGGWRDSTWTRVNAIGSTATTFGADFPVRCIYTDCHVVGSGRGTTIAGNNPVSYPEARSGFGIGFGHYDDESISFIGCSARNCLRGGFFFERQDARNTLRRDAVIRMVGCESSGNGIGVIDVGCAGVVAIDCKFTDNVSAGYYTGINSNAKAGGLRGRLSNCTIMRNRYGVYITGSVASNPVGYTAVAGGYSFETCRIEGNTGHGVLAENWELEAGGLTFSRCDFVRNGGYGVLLRSATVPLRDFALDHCTFDGNAGVGGALLVPLMAPRVEENDFVNSIGTAQEIGLMWHPAEPVLYPRVQGNTYRRIPTPTVNASRLTPVTAGSDLVVTAANDSDTPTGVLHSEILTGDGSTATTLGPGWTGAVIGSALSWSKNDAGAKVEGGSAGARAIQYRDFGRSDILVTAHIPTAATAATTRFRGVVLAYDGLNAVLAGVDDLTNAFGLTGFYGLWKLVNNIPTLLHQTTVPALEGHRVSLARAAGSTVTTLFIDGIAAHTVDIPDVPVSTKAGVAAAAGTTTRRVIRFRALTYTA